MPRKKPSFMAGPSRFVLKAVWALWGLGVGFQTGQLGGQDRLPKAAKSTSEPAPTSDPLRDEILKVNYVFNRGLHDLALPRYEKILEANPSYSRPDLLHYPIALCHYNLAIADAEKGKRETEPAEASLVRKEHLKKAVFHFKEALKRKELESRAAATRLLGQSLLLLDDYAAAAKTFQWVVDRLPDSSEAPLARMGLAECLYFQGSYPAAAKIYRESLESGARGEEADRAEFYLAMSLYKSGEAGDAESIAESIAVFEKAAARPPQKGSSKYALDSRYMLALARQSKGDLTGAVEAFRELARSGGSSYGELAQFGLAAALFRSGKLKEAQEELERFQAAFPASDRKDEAALLLARALLETKQSGPAAKILQELRNSPTVGDEASLWVARLFTRHGKHRSAANVLAAALKSFPRSRLRDDLELDLISAEVADGDFKGALDEIARVEAGAAQGSSSEQAAYLKAYALHRAKRLEESSSACGQFRESFPQSRYLKDVLQIEAENKLLSGDPPGAHALYETFLEKFGKELDAPTRLKGMFRSAQAVYLTKDYARALKLFEALSSSAQGVEEARTLTEDPVLQPLSYLMGECAYQEKDYARAVSELSAFLKQAGGNTGLDVEVSDARFKVAHALQLSGNSQEAREAFQNALKADAKTSHREQILFELGQIDYTLKNPESAVRSFETLLAEYPSSGFAPHALKFLGWMAYEAKEAPRAAAYYQKLLDEFASHPAAADADYHLALCLRQLGKTEEAREALQRFRKKNPGDPRAGQSEIEEAVALSKEKKYDEALAILGRLRSQNPTAESLTSILYETAWCHRGRGDVEQARKTYEELLASGPPQALLSSATLELGELELEAKNYSRAKEILSPLAGAQGPQQEKAAYRLVWVKQFLGDAAGVASSYESFARDFPKSELLSELGILAAKAYVAQGEASRAAPIFQSLAEGRPDSPEAETALVSLGECLAEQKKFEEAKSRFAAFLKRYPGSQLAYRAHFGTAWAMENLGQSEKAQEVYREVVKETKTAMGARAQFQIGQCLAGKKDYKGAIVEFLQVPAGFNFPEWSSKALLQVGGCFEALDDTENARKYYSEVKEAFPGRDEAKLAEERLQKLEQQ